MHEGFGLIHIVKQSAAEHARFVERATVAEPDRCDCGKAEKITRLGSWTAYYERDICTARTDFCQPLPPRGCPERDKYEFNRNVYWPVARFLGTTEGQIVSWLVFLAVVGLIVGLLFLVIRWLVRIVRRFRAAAPSS